MTLRRVMEHSLFAVFFFLFLSPVVLAAEQNDYRIAIYGEDLPALRQELTREDIDILGINRREGFVEAIVTSPELENLKNRGFSITIVEHRVDKITRGVPSGYRHYDTLVSEMWSIESNYPGIAKVIDIGATYGIGTTHEGRYLYAMKISDNVTFDEDEPNVYIVSTHHAREITTAEYALWIIEQLTSLYATDPLIKDWVDSQQIYIAVVWNPDGHTYCFEVDDWWRKNRKPVSGSSYYGIDLNRNYDFRWHGPASGSTYPGDDTFKGPYPNSEEETQAEIAFGSDRHFVKVLDFHSYGSEVVYTYYDSYNFPSVLETWFKNKAQEMADAFNYSGSHRKASAEGEHYQWQLCHNGAFSYLVETGYEFQPAYSTAQNEFSNHIWPGVQWFLGHEIPLWGHVTDAIYFTPIRATMSIAGITYTQNEIRKSESMYGRYHYFLPPGNYEITFTAPGYLPAVRNVTIVDAVSTQLEVTMQPEPTIPTLSTCGLVIILILFSGLFLSRMNYSTLVSVPSPSVTRSEMQKKR